MSFTVLAANDPQDRLDWLKLWRDSPHRVTFTHPAYCEMFVGPSQVAQCASWAEGSVRVMFPFILSLVPGIVGGAGSTIWRDIASPYGYGGPYVWGVGDPEVGSRFWHALDGWCGDQNVVSEFVRFDLDPRRLLDYPGVVREVNLNVVRTLPSSFDELWMDVEHKVRKNVNRARNSGVSVALDTSGDLLEQFFPVYEATMERRGADEAHRYDMRWLRTLNASLPGHYLYAVARRDGTPISAELVLLSGVSMFSFLGGTDTKASNHRPNDLLKYEIMRWGTETGREHFVLGGGYRPDDGIFRYKKAFAPRGLVPFRVGTRIHNPQVYAELTEARSNAAGERANLLDRSFFPAYRAPLSTSARKGTQSSRPTVDDDQVGKG